MSTTETPAGYTYRAENYCIHHALTNFERNLNNPMFDVHQLDHIGIEDAEIMDIAAGLAKVDLTDPESYDSDDFPKPFTKDQIEDPTDWCDGCLIRFSDGVQLKPFTVTGLTLQNGQHIFSHVGMGQFGQGLHACFTEEEDGIARWCSHVVAEDPGKAFKLIEDRLMEGPFDEEPPVLHPLHTV